jgi:hypothetical protein
VAEKPRENVSALHRIDDLALASSIASHKTTHGLVMSTLGKAYLSNTITGPSLPHGPMNGKWNVYFSILMTIIT